MEKITPQRKQMAINACNNAHVGIHRALQELDRGAVAAAKQLISKQIAALAAALAVL